MSEMQAHAPNMPERLERRLVHMEEQLHHESREIGPEPILGLEETREKYGFNGTLLARMTIPADAKDPEAPGGFKQLGIIDFGPDTSRDHKTTIMWMNGKPLKEYGGTPWRYAIVGLNYTAGTHMVPMMELTGDKVIGRSDVPREETGRDYHPLGLYNTPVNAGISRKHLRVHVDEQGALHVEDTSANGTLLEYNAVEALSSPERKFDIERLEVKRGIGHIASQGELVGVELVPSAAEITVSPVEAAKQAFAQLENPLLDDLSVLEAMRAKMNQAQQKEFDHWRLEQAAVRKQSPLEVIGKYGEKDEMGTYSVRGEGAKQFVESLQALGVTAEAPTPDQIQRGIERARHLVDTGKAVSYLRKEPFMHSDGFRALIEGAQKTMVRIVDAPAYIDPAQIAGADGHDSWAGRGRSGDGEVGIREIEVSEKLGGRTKRMSIEQIEDYATRETPLPGYGYGDFSLILTPEGPVYYAHNAHKTSAAKLRGEPLGFRTLWIYDARKK